MQKHSFAVLDQKYAFFGKIWSKNQISQFKLKFGTYNNFDMTKSRWWSFFSLFEPFV